ncbi:TIGR03084 family metal-binding protein [Actinophytocola sp.]|uniref:TIGR03084 family metal-binding protein n=1 Tax=Actinophytocola sp. TaxID=1872138 RepID=UPI002D8009DC|nr:TIGR03084 family metal-binding protein [Actinophytocola sp.]HET9139509.1 TIGR03084 family metal-binding protein [Actinophytocola sp.]HEU5111620.1 TIGR03084 family metal-binding protein [Micromonosporaceae bacterium]
MAAQDVIAALTADGDEVDQLVAWLDEGQWALATPAEGWTIAHQIAHLAATFKLAGLAAADPQAFGALVSQLSPDFDANVRMAMAEFVADPPEVLLGRWRQEKATAIKALAAVPDTEVVPWLVRPLPPAVLACAGMMELFGHGQDIADALGVRRTPTDRIRYLVGFAVQVWDFGYLARGIETPDVALRFELTAPSGQVWEFGPAESTERITGPAHDFCLLTTRRRHRDDLALTASGAEADRWLDIAQAYRGPAGPGRAPGQFAS